MTTTTLLSVPATVGRLGPIAPNAPGRDTRLLDEALEPWPASPLVNAQTFATVEEMAAASDVVVSGVLVRGSRAVKNLDLGGPNDVASNLPQIQFDGLHFRITDVAKGEFKRGDELTLALPSIVEVDDGAELRPMRVVSDLPDLFARGLRDSPGTQQYLIFAVSREGWESVYELVSPEGLAEVSSNGRLGVPSDRGPLRNSVSDLSDVLVRVQA